MVAGEDAVVKRAVTFLVVTFLAVALVVAATPQQAAARHRHHHHPAVQPADGADPGPAAFVRLSPNPRAAAMRASEDALRKVLVSDPVEGAARTPGALRDPKIRAQISAALATATVPRPDLGGWRHRDGGYGWVGPLFWPFAADDIFDAAFWGDGVDATFWGYGVGDLTAGVFGVYPDDDLTAYARYLPHREPAAPGADGAAASSNLLERMCGEARADIAGVPAETVRASLQADDAARAALGRLAEAMRQATQRLAAACPNALPLGARQRVAVMSQRLDAMIAAIDGVAPPLADLFARLNDAQKTQFTELGSASSAPAAASPPSPASATPASASTAAARACAAAQATPPWPAAALEQAVGHGEAQRKALDGLHGAIGQAAALLAPTCQPADATTPPARLAAIKARVVAMRAALGTLDAALDPVFASLDSVQAVDFDQVGSAPAQALAMAAAARRMRGLSAPGAAGSVAPNAAETRAADAGAKSSQTGRPERRGAGRRHLVRYAHRRAPGPVRVLGRMLGALIP